MNPNFNIIFDDDFQLLQFKRYNRNFTTDIVFKQVSAIINDHIKLLNEEAYKRNFSSILSINFPNELPGDQIEYYNKIDKQYDLIIANLFLHHVNQIEDLLKHYHKHLNTGGVLIATLFGGRTLIELRQILEAAELELKGGVSPRVLPMINVSDGGRLLQNAGFKQITVQTELLQVYYKNFELMLRHSKIIGNSNSLLKRNKKFVGKRFFELAALRAETFFKSNDYINTFEILSFTGIK